MFPEYFKIREVSAKSVRKWLPAFQSIIDIEPSLCSTIVSAVVAIPNKSLCNITSACILSLSFRSIFSSKEFIPNLPNILVNVGESNQENHDSGILSCSPGFSFDNSLIRLSISIVGWLLNILINFSIIAWATEPAAVLVVFFIL